MSHAMHADGAGYTIADEERLDFDAVINKTAPLSEYVLYATPISGQETAEIINQMKDLFTGEAVGTATNALIGNIDTSLSKTNSNQFYLGPEAQKNIGNMNTIGEHISDLSNYSSQIDVVQITGLIDQYNSSLSELKHDARRSLLEQAATTFNNKKVEWVDPPITKTYSWKDYEAYAIQMPNDDPEFLAPTENEEYEFEEISFTSEKTDIIRDPDTNEVISYSTLYRRKWKIHKYKKINCNKGFKKIKSPWDPTFEEIEAQFDLVGCPVPYDRNHPQVQACAEKNWEWRNGHYYS